MRVGEAVIEALAGRGVELVFGIPGVHTIELYRGLARSGIRAVTARHEQGAAFMADGWARVSGRPGVCVLITGPGVTNALTPVAQAHHDSVPLFMLASTTARPDAGGGRGPLHDLPDQALLLRSVTAWSRTVTAPEEVATALAEAWTAMESGRPRPVHLALPVDLLDEECEPFPALPSGPRRDAADREEVARAASLLNEAKRPLMLLGGGAADAGIPAAEVGARLDAPIALTGNANGIVPASHPLCLGATLPFGSVQALVAEADVALLVGTELSEVDVAYSGRPLPLRGRVVRVDADPGQIYTGVPASVGLVGDAAATLWALVEHVVDRGGEGVAAARVASALAGLEWTSESRRHHPWLDALERALPADRIVALDSTQIAYTGQHYLRAERPRSWLAPYGYGTLGPAVPMAIGAKLAAPDRPVAAIVGDGGLLFTVAELATAAELGLALPVVLWDNRGYGEIRDSFDRAGAPRIGTETTAPDLLAVARGLGCATADAADPGALAAAVEAALEAPGPTVIRVAA